jgi:hypothetical protein
MIFMMMLSLEVGRLRLFKRHDGLLEMMCFVNILTLYLR